MRGSATGNLGALLTPWNLLEGVASLPRGFSKENRDNPRQPRAGRLAELPLSFPCFCTSELLAGLQNTPPGRQVPGSHVGKPQTVRLTENRWPFFRRGPRPGAWRVLCAGLGRPGPPLCIPRHTTASSHGCCACLSPRKEVCEAPPSRQTFTQHSHPKHSCLLSGPSLNPPSRQAPWEALASRPPQGNPPSLFLAGCLEGGCSLSLLSTMDICHQGKPTVANMSPRHVSGPAGIFSSPDSP